MAYTLALENPEVLAAQLGPVALVLVASQLHDQEPPYRQEQSPGL